MNDDNCTQYTVTDATLQAMITDAHAYWTPIEWDPIIGCVLKNVGLNTTLRGVNNFPLQDLF